jgi:spore maturation protein CgeE
MFSKFSNTEIVYVKKFAESYEDDEIISFYDNKIPDMYTYNFTLIKEDVCLEKFKKIIVAELEKRKQENADFLRIELNFSIKDDFINDLPVIPEVTKYDYMYIEPKNSYSLTGNEGCIIKKALSEKVLQEGMEVDILANELTMGAEFARRRIHRKLEVYKQLDSNLNLYVFYYNGIAIGNCELMFNEHIAKLEDFDVLEEYQRKGFGTAVIKYLLEEAKEHSIEFVYLMTDSGDTAKEMYIKCGFKKAGEKTELFFDLK